MKTRTRTCDRTSTRPLEGVIRDVALDILLCSKCASSRRCAKKSFSWSGTSLKSMDKSGPRKEAFALVGTHAKAHSDKKTKLCGLIAILA